jgi:hypothetical protein
MNRSIVMTSEITTVADLIAALTTYPPDAAVRLAVAPGYPQAAAVGPLACSPDDADLTGYERPRRDEPGGEPTVWIAEGAQLGYLPEIARNALGPWAR